MRLSKDERRALEEVRDIIQAHLKERFAGRRITKALQAEIKAELCGIFPLLEAWASDDEPTAE